MPAKLRIFRDNAKRSGTKKHKKSPEGLFLTSGTLSFLEGESFLVFLLDGNALLLDTGSLTRELAQIVQLGATHLAVLVHLDAVNVGRLQGEDTLHAHGTRHLTNGETLLLTMTADLDDHATIELNTLLSTLDNFVTNSNSVARCELFKLLAGLLGLGTIAGCKSFLSNFN